MNGGYLRFQAQYRRRIRVPRLDDIDQIQARNLSEAFEARDVEAATQVALGLYGLDEIPS
jgi:adenine-specific DNA-methyltransferase